METFSCGAGQHTLCIHESIRRHRYRPAVDIHSFRQRGGSDGNVGISLFTTFRWRSSQGCLYESG
jgi:hypothetical protein